MQLSQQKFRLLVAEKAANNATKRSRLPVLPSRFLDVGAWHVRAVVRILGIDRSGRSGGCVRSYRVSHPFPKFRLWGKPAEIRAPLRRL